MKERIEKENILNFTLDYKTIDHMIKCTVNLSEYEIKYFYRSYINLFIVTNMSFFN